MDLLRQTLIDHGACLAGCADLGVILPQDRSGMPRGIAIAAALDASVVRTIRDGPTRRYYDEYRRVNDLLDRLSSLAVEHLRERGYNAVSLATTNVGIDPATHSTPLPHKTVATRAGLGWIGKCALLVTEQYGSAVRLTTVLTDAPLPTAKPVESSQCGDCRACVDGCPGKAPSGLNWSRGRHRDSFFDTFACRRAARELAARAAGVSETICGLCIAQCPWTREYMRRSGAQAFQRAGKHGVSSAGQHTALQAP